MSGRSSIIQWSENPIPRDQFLLNSLYPIKFPPKYRDIISHSLRKLLHKRRGFYGLFVVDFNFITGVMATLMKMLYCN